MSEAFSPTIVLAIFYIVFFSQIYVISIRYPRKFVKRIAYVLDNFPPSEYPKLYPNVDDGYVARENRRLGLYSGINYATAVLGVAILIGMAVSDYQPAHKGGGEIFVMLYFFIQITPLIVISIREFMHFKLLRDGFDERVRTADLKPRQLFDFVSPVLVGAAVLAYLLLVLLVFLGGFGDYSQNTAPYESVIIITLMNIAFIFVIRRFVGGSKMDPYKDGKDQEKQAEVMAKTLTISSILISVFLVITEAADQYALEVFDPVLTSFYMQLCLILGVGLTFRIEKVEDMNFDVYRDDASA